MQTDLDDGLAWLAAQGIADPGRACIMGASYGGYAALWAAAQDVSPYRCAISFAGISDVKAQLDYDHKTFGERDFRAWRQRIQGGAPSLDSLSPLSRVAKMHLPRFLVAGRTGRLRWLGGPGRERREGRCKGQKSELNSTSPHAPVPPWVAACFRRL